VKRTTVILPLLLPRLSDKAAAQLIELLRTILDAIEHHYAVQIHQHQKHEHPRDLQRQCARSISASPLDPPF
jgi:hypothetical protein